MNRKKLNIHWNSKEFSELDIDELYQILELRARIFVVEQDCPYNDLDGKDQKAIHVTGVDKNTGKLLAYTRIFAPGDYFEQASIGRVVVAETARGTGLGIELMQESIRLIYQLFKETTIKIGAQEYLRKFYTDLGFDQIGEGYLEDGIPHIYMVRSKKLKEKS